MAKKKQRRAPKKQKRLTEEELIASLLIANANNIRPVTTNKNQRLNPDYLQRFRGETKYNTPLHLILPPRA